MTSSERMWWMVMAYADVQSEIEAHLRKDGERGILWMNVSIKARRKLVEDYGVNLDTIGDRARDKAVELFELEKKKSLEEKPAALELNNLLEQCKKALDE